jgi:hypothetical protein
MDDTLFGHDRVDGLVAKLQQATWTENGKIRRWPANDVLDRQFIASLMKENPGKDIGALIPEWIAWMLDHDSKEKVRPRARFQRWVATSGNGPRARQQGHGAPSSRGGRSRTGGAPAGTFAGSGYRDWS